MTNNVLDMKQGFSLAEQVPCFFRSKFSTQTLAQCVQQGHFNLSLIGQTVHQVSC